MSLQRPVEKSRKSRSSRRESLSLKARAEKEREARHP